MSSMAAILMFILASFIIGAGIAWLVSSVVVAPLKKVKPQVVEIINKE